jgi:hypothetical protein
MWLFTGQNTNKEVNKMSRSSNQHVVPQAKDYLNKMKYEVAGEVGVSLKEGYNGGISARDAGRVGGNMVKKMIQQAESTMGAQSGTSGYQRY